ncbi:MAG TPA: hypothetical protein VL172_00315 [Kofleriaceae bacterium]|nr:hypothetical protein [Kofleriaceae bacterium]
MIDDDASIREEVSEWADLTPAELWRLAQLCSRDAIWAVRASPEPQRILDHVDPLPESTVTVLQRLRRAAGAGGGGR